MTACWCSQSLLQRAGVRHGRRKGKVGRPEPRRMRTRNERLGRYRGTEARKGRRETEKGRGETGDDDAVAWSRAANYAEWRSRCRARVLRAWTQAAEVGKKLTPYGSGVPGARPSVDSSEGRERTRDKEARAHEGQGKKAYETAKGGVQEKRADERREEEEVQEKLKEEGAGDPRIVSYPRGKMKARAHVEGEDPGTVHDGRAAEGSRRGMKNRHRAMTRRTTLKEVRESRIVWDGDSGAESADVCVRK
ncbi:hypothetical protein DFH09DRAFT_1502292 [Mycena vulgaris]|nr:hypothetical protein DFH09DRAFT_1502292 [Mycena vulgaris]